MLCVDMRNQGSEDEIYAFQSTSEASEASLFDAVTSSGAAVSGEYVVLMSVLKYFMAHVKDVDAVVPPCRLIGGAVDVVGACVRFQIERVFRRLRLDTAELLVAAHSQVHHLRESSRSLSQGTTSAGMRILPVAQDAARSFTALMQQVLRQMEPLAQTGASILREMSRLFSDLVQVCIRMRVWMSSSFSVDQHSQACMVYTPILYVYTVAVLPLPQVVQRVNGDVYRREACVRRSHWYRG